MATIHPLAKFYNSPEQLELMRNFTGESNLHEVEIDLDRIERVILNDVWDKLSRGLLKDIQKTVARDVYEQINEGLKKIFA